MEYFGSTPENPPDYCIDRVRASDLYIGLIGDRFGAVTQIEYQTARDAQLPCLIYFRQTAGEPGNEHQRAFRAALKRDHVVFTFADTNELRVQFAIDFLKLLRGPLFYKAKFAPQAIPTDALRVFGEAALPEQIDAVAYKKYVPQLYIRRAAESEAERFITFPEYYREQLGSIFDDLDKIRHANSALQITDADFKRLADEIVRANSLDVAAEAVSQLESRFKLPQSLEILRRVDDFFQTRDPVTLRSCLTSIGRTLHGLPGVEEDQVKRAIFILEDTWRSFRTSSHKPSRFLLVNILELLPSAPKSSDPRDGILLASDVLQRLRLMLGDYSRRCLAIVDQAGRGKINILCHLAADLAQKYPVFLIAGQSIDTTPFAVEKHIQQILDRQLTGAFPDWLNRASIGLESTGSWLYVLIDGINESTQPAALSQRLAEFLASVANKRVRVIVTCRDILWEMFRRTLRPYLSTERPVELQDFNEVERHSALTAYLTAYGIRAEMSPRAQSALRHPLLLRIFCEVYRHKELDYVDSVLNLSIFQSFLDIVSREMAQQLGLIDGAAINEWLLKFARLVWKRKEMSIPRAALDAQPHDFERANSIYVRLRNSFVISEVNHTVRFVYDELCEYMLALCWRDEISRGSMSREQVIHAASLQPESQPPAHCSVDKGIAKGVQHRPRHPVIWMRERHRAEIRLNQYQPTPGPYHSDSFLQSQLRIRHVQQQARSTARVERSIWKRKLLRIGDQKA